MNKQMDRHVYTWTDEQTNGCMALEQTDGQTHEQINRQIVVWDLYKQMDRHINTWTDEQTDAWDFEQTFGQTRRHMEQNRWTDK